MKLGRVEYNLRHRVCRAVPDSDKDLCPWCGFPLRIHTEVERAYCSRMNRYQNEHDGLPTALAFVAVLLGGIAAIWVL